MSKLPTDWTVAKLGDVLQLKYGKSLPAKARVDGDVPVFGSNGAVGTHNRALAKGPVIVVGRKGSVGEVNYSESACWPIDTTYFVDEFREHEPRFWYHALRYLNLGSLDRATAIPGLNREDAYDLSVPVPPPQEQKRIADKLDRLLAAVDTCKARLDAIPDILKRFRQSVLAAAVSGELTEEWRACNGVAFNWKESNLQAVASVGTGATPLRSNRRFYSDSGTPWVTSAATAQSVVRQSTEYVTDAAIAVHRLRKYPIGTLLVAMYGEGRTRGQVTELGIEATINQACAAIVVDAKKVEPKFIKLSLQANYLQMRELAEGGNQPNLNLSKMKDFRLLLPLEMREQVEIVRRAEGLLAHADRVELYLTAAYAQVERVASSLLAKAFRGELISQDPTFESAADLAAGRTSPLEQPVHVSEADQSTYRSDHVRNRMRFREVQS